jgi:acyl-coenzyme A thioesterase PaaI-like protein
MTNPFKRVFAKPSGKSAPFDPIDFTGKLMGKIPGGLAGESARRRLLDLLLTLGIPFNRWLGLRIGEIGETRVTIVSPPSVLRRNHVGTAHACAQALIGEYAAGLLVAQRFPLDTYRMIIGRLEIDYHKAGHGTLYGTSKAPAQWPELENEEGWVPMETEITDEKGTLVSVCRTRWQVKSWQRIEEDKASRESAG